MTTTVHKNLTGADLHEPKGADTALANQVYVSDGAGSGSWVAASSVITNTAFTTGDLKPTHKTTADTGWILWSDSTIGDASSGASIRANADTANLFALYWNTFANTVCIVSGGRGISAAADFAAHKTLSLPPGAGRALALSGLGNGLTNRVLGLSLGTETKTLILAHLPTGITSSFSVSVGSGGLTIPLSSGAVSSLQTQGSSTTNITPANSSGTWSGSTTLTGSGTATSNNTSGAAFDGMTPTSYINVMIKL